MTCPLLSALGPRPAGAVTSRYIVDQLNRAITDGSLPAGTKVSQQLIADHMGVSRMPVREALRQAEAMGLISHNPNRTSVVLDLAAGEGSELVQALARETTLKAQLAEALEVLDACVRSGDLPSEIEWKARGILKGRRGYVEDRAGGHIDEARI